MRDKKTLLVLGIGIQSILVIFFTGASFWVASTDNQGFNVVLTALLNIVYVIGGYYILRKQRTQFAIGFLLGVTSMITIISLMTAIYWGQLSNCEPIEKDIEQYSCSQKTAYGVVSAFSAILFVCQLLFLGALILWKGEVVEELGLYDELPRPFSGGFSQRSEHIDVSSSLHQPSAVDL